MTGPLLIDSYNVIRPFPTLFLRPIEGEDDLATCRQLVGGQVSNEKAQRVAGGCVLGGLPSVEAPVHGCRRRQQQSQLLALRHRAAFVVESPFEIHGPLPLNLIALYGLWGLVEYFAVAQGSS